MTDAISMIEFGDEVLAAVAQLEAEIEAGNIAEEPLMVTGEVLGVLLPLDWVADLLQRGAKGIKR
jgi:hypothetical protein